MRLNDLKVKFKEFYGSESAVAVNSPGRVEIIGSHTDYNLGYALGGAISKSTIGLFKKREDRNNTVGNEDTDDTSDESNQ